MIQRFKTALKLILCRCIYCTGIFHIYMKGIFLKRKKFPVVIINHHRFVENFDEVMEVQATVSHSINNFEKEISFLKKYFHVASLDEVVDALKENKTFDRPTVVLTVDDGFQDNYELLFPVLKKYDASATIFLTTGVIGTKKSIWVNQIERIFLGTDKKLFETNGLVSQETLSISDLQEKRNAFNKIVQALKDVPTADRNQYIDTIEQQLGMPTNGNRLMLNWNEVKSMYKDKVIFGAHTVTHPILTNLSIEEAKAEIVDSKKDIENNLGIPVRHFAFPNGRPKDFNEELRQYCKDVGFDSICSCDYGANNRSDDNWHLKRIGVHESLSLFAMNVLRAFNAAR